MNKLLVILGSTSTGKTDLALQLAGKFQGELLSADSRQVYKGLDVGTGKLPGKKVDVKKGHGYWEMDGIKVWMYDVADPKEQYTVYHYVQNGNKVIEEILKRGKLPIIVGGTGLYLKALLEGLPNLGIPIDPRLRKELEEFSREQLQLRLQKASPSKWKSLNESDRQNPRRLVRAIECSIASLRGALVPNQSSWDDNPTEIASLVARNDVLKIGLNAPREILYQRIDERIVSRINQGMVEEAQALHKKGLSLKRMRQLGLEYGVLANYLMGKIKGKEELIKVLQGRIHGYARRQTTWFKKEKDVLWFDITKSGWSDEVESSINSWYYASNE